MTPECGFVYVLAVNKLAILVSRNWIDLSFVLVETANVSGSIFSARLLITKSSIILGDLSTFRLLKFRLIRGNAYYERE